MTEAQKNQIIDSLKDIIKAAATPDNEINLLPEMTLKFIASEAKAALLAITQDA